MELLGSTKKGVDQDKNGEYVKKLESVGFFLVHWNLVNNNHQQASLFNKQFDHYEIHLLTMLNATNNFFIR